ncbi:MAG: LysM peptidoglycan-binding domain-containing protein [Planctomycetes bacterium]|nr:LysM peptidoglycan-binding domain-containing protein [Planctomycetota bacterium]
MSKDVIIAGAIVAACLGLVTVAFVVPKHKSAPQPLDLANNDPPPSAPSAPSPDSTALPGDLPGGLGNTPPSNFNNFTAQSPLPPAGPGLGQQNTGSGGQQLPPSNSFQSPQQQNFPPTPPPPIPALDPLPPASSETKVHIVAANETLGDISMKYYNTSKNWKKIAEANKVDPNELQVGQKLTIPVLAAAPVTPKVGELPPSTNPGERTYKVKKGETYYLIAKRELGSASRWKELQKLNGIASEDLHEGQVIKLPAGKTIDDKPTLPVAPGASDGGPGKVHIVAAGETLSDISKKHYGTTTKWREIVKANPGVDPEGLKVGDKLVLPEIAGTAPKDAAAPPAPAPTPLGAPEGAGEYVVKAKDTFDIIATKELGNKALARKIAELNPGVDSSHLRIGQKLKLPGKAKSGGGTAPAPLGNGPTSFPVPAPVNPVGGYPAPGSYPTPGGAFPGSSPAPGGAFPGSTPAPGGSFPGSTSPGGFPAAPRATTPPAPSSPFPPASPTGGTSRSNGGFPP